MSAAATLLGYGGAADPFWTYDGVLLLCNGTNGSNTFTDSGPVGRTQALGGTPTISTSSPKYGTGCATFDGSLDVIQCGGTTGFDFTGDFTIDAWTRPAAAAPTGMPWGIMSVAESTLSAGQMTLYYSSTGGSARFMNFVVGTGLTVAVTGSCDGMDDGAWHHVAVTRIGTNVYLYYDGVNIGTGTLSGTVGSSSLKWEWGMWRYEEQTGNPGHGSWNGQLDCMRCTRGVARWYGTGSFTPPPSEASYLP